MLFHDVNPQSQGTQPQPCGGPISVRKALAALGLLPLTRSDWTLAYDGGDGATWWGGLMAFRRLA